MCKYGMFLQLHLLKLTHALNTCNTGVTIIQGEYRGTCPQLPLLSEKDRNTPIEQSLILIKYLSTLTEFVIKSMINFKQLLNFICNSTHLRTDKFQDPQNSMHNVGLGLALYLLLKHTLKFILTKLKFLNFFERGCALRPSSLTCSMLCMQLIMYVATYNLRLLYTLN